MRSSIEKCEICANELDARKEWHWDLSCKSIANEYVNVIIGTEWHPLKDFEVFAALMLIYVARKKVCWTNSVLKNVFSKENR